MNKEAIKTNFSKYARYYDRYSTVQSFCASRLISGIKDNSFSKILDIGCGTGNFTKLLSDKFPQAHIKAVDISKEMIDVAKKKFSREEIEFIIADGEKIDFKEQFDFIGSNATFQWFENIEGALLRYKEILCENGVILFSAFGPLTFYELNNSLRELFGKDISTSSCNFIEAKIIKTILRQLFKKVKVEEEMYKEKHSSLADLLKKIKYSGIRGNGLDGKNFWTPNTISKLENIYKKKYNDIVATYQVFFCRA